MTTPAAPRIDDRLRRYIAGAAFFDTPAEATRAAGALAWALGLPRPSYEQVRKLMRFHRRKQNPFRRLIEVAARAFARCRELGRALLRTARRVPRLCNSLLRT